MDLFLIEVEDERARNETMDLKTMTIWVDVDNAAAAALEIQPSIVFNTLFN